MGLGVETETIKRIHEGKSQSARIAGGIGRVLAEHPQVRYWLLDPTHPDHKPIFDALGMSARQLQREYGRKTVYEPSELSPTTRVALLEPAAGQQRVKDLPKDPNLLIMSREGVKALQNTIHSGRVPVGAGVRPWYKQEWGPLPAWAWLGGGSALLLGLAMLRRG